MARLATPFVVKATELKVAENMSVLVLTVVISGTHTHALKYEE